MNLNDKNIDQLFRDAAQNSGSPRYDHSYWKEMNSILNNQDKRKQGFILWSVAGSLVVALLFSTLFIVNQDESNLLLAEGNSTTVDSSSENLNKETIDKSITPTQSNKNKISPEQSDKRSIIEQSNSTNINIEKDKLITSTTKSKEDLTVTSAKEGIKMQSNSNGNNVIENNTIKGKDLALQTEETENDSDLNENFSIGSLSPRIINLQETEIENELVPFKPQIENPFNYYAKLSAGLMENYETSRPFQSSVFDLSLNIEYQKEQVLFRTGLGFQATANADIVVSERAKVYGFGLTTHQNNLSYQSLYDIYVPIELGYTLNNTSFGFGIQLNYMVGTTMNFESLENNIVVNKEKLKGLDGGLNSFTSQGFVWLEQKISKRFFAGMKVGTNLNSRIKEGRYFNESSTTNPLYGQLTLRYNLNK